MCSFIVLTLLYMMHRGVEGARVADVSALAAGGGLDLELEDHAHVGEGPDVAEDARGTTRVPGEEGVHALEEPVARHEGLAHAELLSGRPEELDPDVAARGCSAASLSATAAKHEATPSMLWASVNPAP